MARRISWDLKVLINGRSYDFSGDCSSSGTGVDSLFVLVKRVLSTRCSEVDELERRLLRKAGKVAWKDRVDTCFAIDLLEREIIVGLRDLPGSVGWTSLGSCKYNLVGEME